MECSIINTVLSLLMKHLVIDQRLKALNFSAFQWSPQGSLVSIGQHFVTTRVIHLPKRTETSLPNYQIGPKWTLSPNWIGPCVSAIAGFQDLFAPNTNSLNILLTTLTWFCIKIHFNHTDYPVEACISFQICYR